MGRLLAAGAHVPEQRLQLLGGGEEPLVSGEAALLAFFKISCPVCQLTLPFLERLHPGRRIRGISQNSARDTAEFAEYYKLTFPILLDPERGFPASNAFGISHVPTTFLVTPDGKIEKVIEGWNRTEMAALGAVRPEDNVPAWKAG